MEEADKYRKQAEPQGMKIFEISEEEKFHMKSVTQLTYKIVDYEYKLGLVKRVLNLRENK